MLDVQVDGFGGLRLTDAARPLLRGASRIELRREPERTRGRQKKARAGREADTPLADADQLVFDRLRALRGQLAREQNVPAYVIFHDATLRAVAREKPRTLGELGAIGGVGAAKLERYGQALLDVLADEPQVC
jgi:ATP-dependent DNA helicase RecQ